MTGGKRARDGESVVGRDRGRFRRGLGPAQRGDRVCLRDGHHRVVGSGRNGVAVRTALRRALPTDSVAEPLLHVRAGAACGNADCRPAMAARRAVEDRVRERVEDCGGAAGKYAHDCSCGRIHEGKRDAG